VSSLRGLFVPEQRQISRFDLTGNPDSGFSISIKKAHRAIGRAGLGAIV
jgi:hypothetical protein